MGCRPGPTNHNPFSRFGAPRTPGPLGCRDAADPGYLTLRGDTPGPLGFNDDSGFDLRRAIDPMDFDYLVRHHELKSKLVESVGLADLHLKHRLWKNASIWKVGGAVVFRVTEIVEDVDGSARAYHPPTETSWDGYGPGRDLAKDHLGNAVGNPGVTAYAHSKDEKDWALTAGCQLFRDLHKARGLEPKAAPAAQPAGAGSNGPPPTQAAQDARAALDKIYKQYGVTKLSELEAKSLSAVCVLFVEGRDKQRSIADWSHVVSWAGIQTKAGKPVVRAEGNNKGFYIPAITPGWADAEKHPWVVLNPPQDEFGVNKTNSAVVIKNGETPSIGYGMVADWGPAGHLGEVSEKMMSNVGVTASNNGGDFIIVQFPKTVSAAEINTEKDVAAIQSDAKAAFDAWTWEGRSGMDLIQELFPTGDQYHRVLRDFVDSDKNYLNAYIDQLMLKLK